MRRNGLINKISSKKAVTGKESMQVLDEQSKAYFNFINSLRSEPTRKSYKFCIKKFLGNTKYFVRFWSSGRKFLLVFVITQLRFHFFQKII